MDKILSDLIIFEMANSHQGSVEHGIAIIREMAKITRKYNVKGGVKLQYRNLDTFIHPCYKGNTEVKHISRFESTRLEKEDFDILVETIREEGLIPLSTPFDEEGADWCMKQGLPIIKVASCSAMDWPWLERLAEAKKPLIVSTGGKSVADIDKIYNFLTHRNCEFAFLHCVAMYPAAEGQLQLDFIDRMKRRYHEVPIGYSGHEEPSDNTAPMLAVAKGAQIFERHVGLPTETIKLNQYSMNPRQADDWVGAIQKARNICSLKKQGEKYISQSEIDSLQSLMRGVYAREDIATGEDIKKEKIFFAMPYLKEKGQMHSGEFMEGLMAQNTYEKNDPVCEQRTITTVNIMRSAIHDVKGLIYEAGITIGDEYEVELSHHYGMESFRQIGATIISIINREYCKKLIVVLPGQSHPSHYHKVKEESFQILYGNLECIIDGNVKHMKPGDIVTVARTSVHSFSSKSGAVFEEISTTHIRGDSYYSDNAINKKDMMSRKTIIKEW